MQGVPTRRRCRGRRLLADLGEVAVKAAQYIPLTEYSFECIRLAMTVEMNVPIADRLHDEHLGQVRKEGPVNG